MIGLEDRQALTRDIHAAQAAGARLKPACEVAGIDLRTLQRWQAGSGLVSGDGRPQAIRPVPGHALSAAERAQLLAVANEPRFAAVPPARIVPMLADEGVYLASESTFSRLLRAHGQSAHRGRAKAPKAVRPPTTQIAAAPGQGVEDGAKPVLESVKHCVVLWLLGSPANMGRALPKAKQHPRAHRAVGC